MTIPIWATSAERRPKQQSRFNLSDGERWFAVYTLPLSEARAQFNLENQRFRTFVPKRLKTVRHARKLNAVEAAFFPRYIFVALDLARDRWRGVNGTFGVSCLVMRGDQPNPVPRGVVEALIATADKRGVLQFGKTLAGIANVHVLGHALTVEPTDAGFAERRDFLLVGALHDDDSPNVDGLFWFVRQVMPRLDAAIGEDFRVRVAGNPRAPALKRLRHERVELLGRVDDLSPEYGRARVFVGPTRFTAGHAAQIARSRRPRCADCRHRPARDAARVERRRRIAECRFGRERRQASRAPLP